MTTQNRSPFHFLCLMIWHRLYIFCMQRHLSRSFTRCQNDPQEEHGGLMSLYKGGAYFIRFEQKKKNGFKGKKKVCQFEDVVFQPGVAKILGLLAFISWFFLLNCWTVHEEGGEEAEGFSVYDTKQTLNWCKIKQSIICKVFYKVEVKSPRSYSFGRCLYYKHRPKT